MALHAGAARRLTPAGGADLSPALSPDGKWLAVASGGGKTGEADVVMMAAADGSQRRTIARNAGWPTFTHDSQTLLYHRLAPDGWCALPECRCACSGCAAKAWAAPHAPCKDHMTMQLKSYTFMQVERLSEAAGWWGGGAAHSCWHRRVHTCRMCGPGHGCGCHAAQAGRIPVSTWTTQVTLSIAGIHLHALSSHLFQHTHCCLAPACIVFVQPFLRRSWLPCHPNQVNGLETMHAGTSRCWQRREAPGSCTLSLLTSTPTCTTTIRSPRLMALASATTAAGAPAPTPSQTSWRWTLECLVRSFKAQLHAAQGSVHAVAMSENRNKRGRVCQLFK